MSKIHLQQNKETLVTVFTGIGLLAMMVLNLLVLFPAMMEVYSNHTESNNQSPIDIKTVNEAIELLNEP